MNLKRKSFLLSKTRQVTGEEVPAFWVSRFLSSTLLPFLVWGLLIKPNSGKKGTLIIKGLLRDLGLENWKQASEKSLQES